MVTVGQLKEVLSELPDAMEVATADWYGEKVSLDLEDFRKYQVVDTTTYEKHYVLLIPRVDIGEEPD